MNRVELSFHETIRSSESEVLQVARRQTCMLGDPREHTRANLLVVAEGKDVVGPTCSLQNTVRSTRLTLDRPPLPKKRCQDSPGLGRRPAAHGVTAKTLPICGTASPWSSRSASTRRDSA